MRDRDLISLGIEAARVEVRGGDCSQLLADGLHHIFGIGVAVGRWPLSMPNMGGMASAGVPSVSSAEFRDVVRYVPRNPSVDRARLVDTTPFRVSDTVVLTEFWKTDVWWYHHGFRGGIYPAGFSLGIHGGIAGMVGLHRADRDFTGEELAMLDLLREPLQSALRFRAELDGAIRAMASVESTDPTDDRPLTPRERDVLALLTTGRTNAMIGGLLGITERTVRKHLTNIYAKLEVPGRTAAAVRYRNATDARATSPSAGGG